MHHTSTISNPLAGLSAPAPRRSNHYPISDKQRSFIVSLLETRQVDFPVPDLDSLTGGWGGTASDLIDRLKELPVKEQPADPNAPDISGLVAGYYGHEGSRYKIDRPTRGNWAGWLFFKTGSDYHEQRRLGSVRPGGVYQGKARETFEAILADPAAARFEYGRITNNCALCNRKLEDETSVSRGVGPICWGKL